MRGETWKILKQSTAGTPKTRERVGKLNNFCMKSKSWIRSIMLLSVFTCGTTFVLAQTPCSVLKDLDNDLAGGSALVVNSGIGTFTYGIDKLTTAGTSWANGYAFYSGIEIKDGDFVTFNASQGDGVMVGFDAGPNPFPATPPVQNYQVIDYAIYANYVASGTLFQIKPYANGSPLVNSADKPVSVATHSPNTVIKLSRIHNQIRYYADDVLIANRPCSGPLYLAICMYRNDSKITNFQFHRMDSDCDGLPNLEDDAHNYGNGCFGRMDYVNPNFVTGCNTTYSQAINVSQCFDTYDISKNSGLANTYDAGGSSSNRINDQEYVTYKVHSTKGAAVGFSVDDQKCTYTTIDYSLVTYNNTIRVFRYKDAQTADLGNYNANTIFKILFDYKFKLVRFFQSDNNGVSFNEIATFPVSAGVGDLVLDYSLRDIGSQINDLTLYRFQCIECLEGGGNNGRKAVISGENRTPETGHLAYPNPFENSFTLDFEGSAKIFDSFGRLVVELGEVKAGQQVDFSRFAPGVYFLEAKNEKMTKRIKLNKQ